MKTNEAIATASGSINTTSVDTMVGQQDGKPFFMYGTKKMEYKGVIHTRRVVIAGIPTGVNSIRIATATCSEKDRFVKSKGKAIAISRAKSRKPDDVLYLTEDSSAAKQFVARAKKMIDPVI